MKRTVAIIILVFTILNVSSFFIMKAKSPQFTVFTGAVHYPPDYLYYISFITQGKDHWLYSANLKSGESQSYELLNWFYVFGGRIGYILGLSPIVTYQALVVLSSVLYLTAAYALFAVCFPAQPMTRLVAFVLFILSNAFPKITHSAAGWDLNFFYPFNNLGHPFVRLSNVPHHTLIQAAIMAAFVFASKKSYKMLAIVGILLGSMQPLQWAFVTGVIGISALVFSQSLLPAITLGIAGLPFALYLKQLYAGPLYTYMIGWENNQQVLISFKEFIILHGPVMLVGVFALPFFIRRATKITVPLYIYSIIALGIFFSPIPKMLGILNLRFVSVLSIFLASYLCATVISRFTAPIPLTFRYPAMWLGAFLVLAITVPVTYAHITLTRPNANATDVNTYIPLGAYQIFETAKTVIKPGEVSLATPIFTQSYPAFVGRHVFVADQFGTIHFQQKNAQSLAFFSLVGAPEARMKWLHENNISYIFTYAWTPIADLPNLEIIAKNDYAILYKVK